MIFKECCPFSSTVDKEGLDVSLGRNVLVGSNQKRGGEVSLSGGSGGSVCQMRVCGDK